MLKNPLFLSLATAVLVGSTTAPSLAHADLGHGGHSPGSTPTEASPDHHHEHATLEIPAGQPVPTVTLRVHLDAVSGWNLEVETTHFRFAPETINQSSLPTEGHAHLYVNGEKIARLYGHWHHLPSLPPGHNEITVSLNANGHEALTHNGANIESTVVVDVP
jgi:hypothetical protein